MSTRTRRPLLASIAVAASGVTGLALASIAVPAAAAGPTTRFVSVAGGDADNDCTDSGDPCRTIQYAVGQADAGDTISIGPGTYSENVRLRISLTLSGSGATGAGRTTITGAGQPSILVDGVDTSTPPDVTISSVDVSGNSDDDGIDVDSATAHVTNSSVSDNREAGIELENAATATIANSDVSNNGDEGVVLDAGSPQVTVRGSAIHNNGGGGVIVDDGHADIAATTLDRNIGAGFVLNGDGSSGSLDTSTVSNTAPFSGEDESFGGGVLAFPGSSVSVADSTVDGNVGQGVLAFGASVTIASSTISRTSPPLAGANSEDLPAGGLALKSDESTAPSLKVTSTILAGGSSVPACNTGPTDGGHNLASDASCEFSAGSSLDSTPAKLGALTYNGGPTRTRAPAATSAAIDAIPKGAATCVAGAKDQRGVRRPQGSRCDIGAVELAVPHLSLSTSTVGYGRRVKARVSVPGVASGKVTVRTRGFRHAATLVHGAATVRLPARLGVGRHTITATYGGTARTPLSAPAKTVLRVVKQKTRTTVKPAKKSVNPGKKTKLRIKVHGRAGGAYPLGKLKIVLELGHQTVTRTVTLHKRDKGVVRISMTVPGRAGAAKVKVQYRGDSHYKRSTSKQHTLRIH